MDRLVDLLSQDFSPFGIDEEEISRILVGQDVFNYNVSRFARCG